MQVLVSLVVLVGLTILVDGSLLLRDPKQNCMAHGNGTVYDISVLFLNGPITIDTGTYSYTWHCHLNMTCGNQSGDIAICQGDHKSHYWIAGNGSPALWFADFNQNPKDGKGSWSIMYPTQGIRISEVQFIVDPKIDPPQITMDGEDPYTEYQFTVRGKCIGQPLTWDPECADYYKR